MVGILIVGTIVGIAAGGLFSGDSKDEDSIPLTRQLKNTSGHGRNREAGRADKRAGSFSGKRAGNCRYRQQTEFRDRKTEKNKQAEKNEETKELKESIGFDRKNSVKERQQSGRTGKNGTG